MRFYAAFVVTLALFGAPAPVLAADCQAVLNRYLVSLERATWYRTNVHSNDQYDRPFLSHEEQFKRESDSALEADTQLAIFKQNCFSGTFNIRGSQCSTSWYKVVEYSNLVGVSLSRTDTLNRNPVPFLSSDSGWAQQAMDQAQMTAWANIKRFRDMRATELSQMESVCFDWTSEPARNVGAAFIQDAAVELMREKFGSASSPSEKNPQAGAYDCRFIYANGQLTGLVSPTGDRRLQTGDYRLTAEGGTWILTPDGPAPSTSLRFEPSSGRAMSRTMFRSVMVSVAFLRVEPTGRLVVEVVNAAKSKTPVPSIASPDLAPVWAYWSCTAK